MYNVELHHSIAAPWTELEPIRVGPVPSGFGTPGVFLTVSDQDKPVARIDVWPHRAGPFTEFQVWNNRIVLGWNDQVHLVDPRSKVVKSFECDGYFGHLFPFDGCLLIGDATHLICISNISEKLWKSEAVGIDGVIVDELQNGVITGRGEWDPPGGWRPFRLSLLNGQKVEE